MIPFMRLRPICTYEPGKPLKDDPLWTLRENLPPIDEARMLGIPCFPEEKIRKKLKKVKQLLEEPLKEDYGHIRGRRTAQRRFRFRPYSNAEKFTPKNAINSLICRHYALKHGGISLLDFTEKDLAKTFFGPESKIEVPHEVCVRIITELFRYGKSNVLEAFQKKHNKKLGIESTEVKKPEYERRPYPPLWQKPTPKRHW
jgi:hypothetical protein